MMRPPNRKSVKGHLFPTRDKRRPCIPEDTRIYAVGDVHGRLDLLDALLSRIDADLAAAPISHVTEVFLGDYIDRGRFSRQVLDRLIERKASHQTVCLRGNHEGFLTGFLETPSMLAEWLRWGGLETLMSYGLVPTGILDSTRREGLADALKQMMPESHLRFLADLPTTFAFGDFFFVHAGIRPGVSLSSQSEDDLIWIRDEFLLSDQNFGTIIVHGHTPTQEPEVYRNRINIDTGAYATGKLTCLVIEREELFFL